ncbi:hypothetical protein BTO04_03360 [Polaribacter sp. SA4-10]|uniref:restriction endonuclease subunit S n=1 Tax=Polaribacter sp. SA4-10 TaxID=754397 RepID=UPI000B3CA697|nr:restriction endonuclease subunit S [Polaribacter sp. SA4-10]ARV05795.1 hypothetical protein BTO04_03360 [Polaribacter sp. SA4-10]
MSTATTHMDNKPSLQASHCEDEERSKRKQSHPLVPALRFSEFDGDWEKKKLGDVGKIRMCKRIFSSDTTEIGDIPFYKIGTFGKQADAYISNELYLDYRERFSFPKIDDILMSASGTLGRTVIYDGSPSYYQDSNIVWIDNEEELITNSFLFYIYQIVRYDSEGGTIQRLYNSIINNAKFSKPSLPEQQKIASFLSAVDEKIQQLTKKKALLEDYKKGVMQQLFSGQLRFKDENGKDYPDWEEQRFTEVKNLVHGDGDWILSENLGKNEKYSIIQLGNIGLGEFIDKKLKTLSEENFDAVKGTLIKKGDILINRMVDNDLNVCLFPYSGDYITSVDVCWIRSGEEIDNSFISFLIQTRENQKKLLSLSSGSGRVRISKKNLFERFKFQLPLLEEQQKIARYLSSIDTKIEAVTHQITQTQAFKKGLLQQMFV